MDKCFSHVPDSPLAPNASEKLFLYPDLCIEEEKAKIPFKVQDSHIPTREVLEFGSSFGSLEALLKEGNDYINHLENFEKGPLLSLKEKDNFCKELVPIQKALTKVVLQCQKEIFLELDEAKDRESKVLDLRVLEGLSSIGWARNLISEISNILKR